jgi:uncharacterized RmlC-like cupin family protein
VAGEFIYVAPYAVHREGNMTQTVADLVVTRSGSGETIFNVDGPDAAG